MPSIKWVGNKPWGTDFPEYPMPANATLIHGSDNVIKASLPYLVMPLLFTFALVHFKWFVIGSKEVSLLLLPVGIIIGLLLLPVHEYIHAICYPRQATVYVGISMNKFAAFIACNEPLSRTRFIVMSLMPMLLGIIPFLIFLLCPSSAILSAICIPVGILGMISPLPDYMNVHLIHKNVPKGATIQDSNDGLFWYE